MGAESGTWHYGLIARYWAEFNTADPNELAYYRGAIERFGQPALDLACGTGRLLLPLIAAGFEVDGVDISPDMIELCQARALRDGISAAVRVGAMHELDLPRRYGTIYICDSFGIGGRRDRDLEALRRIRACLLPGGALVFSLELPFNDLDEAAWGRWLAGRRDDLPRAWSDDAQHHRTADGDEIELDARLAELDPVGQWRRVEMRARLWHDGAVVAEEIGSLGDALYFVPEVRLMLDVAGFTNVSVEGRYNGRPATADDGTVVFIAIN